MFQTNYRLILFLLLFAIFSAGCATSEVSRPAAHSQGNARTASLSIQEVKNRLNMNRSRSELGFQEARFDPCDYGRRGDTQCRVDYVTIVHFQLLCRMSEGTVDTVSSSELFPVRSNAVRFKLGNTVGMTRTDENGYGQVEVMRPISARNERLRLTIEDRFVATPVSEINRLVVPENWCKL